MTLFVAYNNDDDQMQTWGTNMHRKTSRVSGLIHGGGAVMVVLSARQTSFNSVSQFIGAGISKNGAWLLRSFLLRLIVDRRVLTQRRRRRRMGGDSRLLKAFCDEILQEKWIKCRELFSF